ncbi:ABC transporter permease [Demequina sp. TTPB684]|uniref:ABC transporter permease n=1 Tax=unclassified Demequina TaxID=2620311 RepID=UPI001CF12E0D|nr:MULTISPECIES: ABC transporter permease [unclassified Demequina]MCB2413512.1 ABC transporter permease [Demequina sp. TTPB684]UPU87168.1 ABC transporter permease [Demequina sp. TMPB413]
MSPSAARLIVFGAAGSMRRLVGIAAGVALGTGMLLILLGAYLHLPERDERDGWTTSTGPYRDFTETADLIPIAPADDAVLLHNTPDYFRGEAFEKVVVATTPTTTVEFPAGLEALEAGQYYASPALVALIERYPDDELSDRFGTFQGEIPRGALKGPDQVVALVATDWEMLSAEANARVQKGFPDKGPHAESVLYRIVIGVGSVALLVPIALLVGIVSQLGAAARRERYATVRLIGAGRRAMAGLAALEMGVASLAGAVVGIGVASAIRPAAVLLPVNGTQSYAADLTPSVVWVVATVLGMAALGAGAAWWRAYRDEHGALGASRERAEKPATWRRVIVLVVGLVLFTGSAAWATDPSAPANAIILGLIGGFAMVAFGIVLAGSWLTKVASLVFARQARTGASLVAASRLARHPRATFRSVAGVVVAVFIVSMLSGVVSSVNGLATEEEEPGLLPLSAVAAALDESSDADAMADAARTTAGVEQVVVAYRNDASGMPTVTREEAIALGATGVPQGSYVAVDIYAMLAGDFQQDGPQQAVPATAPDGAPADYLVALTDGSPGAVDRARTALEVAGSMTLSPVTRAEYGGAATLSLTYQLAMLAYIGMAIAVGISALSLTVATVAAALDRKRTFGLLRLGGMPVSDLRRTIAIEAAMPLAVTLVASAGLGFALAFVMVKTLGNGLYFTWPDPLYWWALLGSVAIAAVAVSGSFGVVRRSTEIASTRFE